MGLLQPGTNDPSSTLNGTQRWITPSLNEIASMLDKIEGKIRKEDDEWVAIAQSVAGQQNAYSAYQADMKKKGVTDKNHDAYKPFAIWMRGEPVKGAPGNPTTGSDNLGAVVPKNKEDTNKFGGVSAGDSSFSSTHKGAIGEPTTSSLKVTNLSSISSNMLRNLLGSASVTTENKKAIEAELNSRVGKDKFDIDPTLPSTPEVKPVATTTLTEDVAKNYMKQMIDMSPKDRRAFLRENLGPSLFDSAPMLLNIAKEAYGRPGVVGLPDTLEAAHKLSDLYLDMTSLHTALRSDKESGTVGNVFGRFIDTLSWGLTEEETTKAMKMLKSDSITEKDFAEWHQILASNLGEAAAYGMLAKVIGMVGHGTTSLLSGLAPTATTKAATAATAATAPKTAQEGRKFLANALKKNAAATSSQREVARQQRALAKSLSRSGSVGAPVAPQAGKVITTATGESFNSVEKVKDYLVNTVFRGNQAKLIGKADPSKLNELAAKVWSGEIAPEMAAIRAYVKTTAGKAFLAAAPTAMAAGAYYSQEAEDAMSQIAEQLSALGLD